MMEQSNVSESQILTVGEVALNTGATRAQLKNWDKLGVLQPLRSGEGISNNRKLYTPQDVDRVRIILLLQKMGLSLQEIKAFLGASPEEQRALIVAHSKELRQQYSQLHKNIVLSSMVQMGGVESLKDAADAVDDYEALRDSYAQEESLKGLIRWLKSQPDRKIEQFVLELSQILDGFDALAGCAEWSELELQVARFCDLWGRYFTWPSVGHMLTLHWAFSEGSLERQEIARFLGDRTTEFMGQAFLLAWLSCVLDSIDDVLAHMNRRIIYAQTDEDVEQAALIAGKVFRAFICEFSANPRFCNVLSNSEQVVQFVGMTDALFDLLEDIVLDEEVIRYLSIEELDTIDGPALAAARALTVAFVEGALHDWLICGGFQQLEQRADEWMDNLVARWLERSWKGAAEGGFDRPIRHPGTDGIFEQFDQWFKEWFDTTYPDEPEAHWATEEESCVREKSAREALEEAECARIEEITEGPDEKD